jgi:hypothetical protein
MAVSSQTVAGVNVADRQRETDKADRHHDGIHHGNAPNSYFLSLQQTPFGARMLDLNQACAKSFGAKSFCRITREYVSRLA